MKALAQSDLSYDFEAYNAAGQVWNGATFVTYAVADYASYRIPATKLGDANSSNIDAWFTGTSPAGTARWVMRVRGASLALSYVVWTEDTQLDDIQDKTDLIGVNTVVLAPPAINDTSTTDLIIGDDYNAANDREIAFEFTAITGFTLGVCTAKFGAKKPDSPTVNFFLVTAAAPAITDVGGGMWKVVFEIDKAATSSLKPGTYDWSVEIVEAGEEVTVAKNTKTGSRIRLIEKQT